MSDQDQHNQREGFGADQQSEGPWERTLTSGRFGSPERVGHVIRVVRVGLRGLHKSQLPRMAAALAYRTIFSLVPVLVVSIAVAGAFMKGEQLNVQVDRLVDYLGLNTIEVQGPPTLPEGGDQNGPVDASLEPPEDNVVTSPMDPAANSTKLEDLLRDQVTQIQEVSFETVGIVGVLFLFYAALSMLMELERAFNTICRAPRGRSIARRITTYWTTLTLGAVFLFATFYVSDVVAAWLVGLGRVGESETSLLSQSLIEAAINIILTAGLLLLAYTTVPNARVEFRSALAGALVASIAWAVGKWGFTEYVKHATGLEKLYGAIALLPLFLMWIYLTWVIVLFGLQIAHMLQTFDEWKQEADLERENDEVPPFVEGVSAIDLAVGVALRFASGKPARLGEIAVEAGLEERAATRLIERLVETGYLCRVESDDPGRTLVLAKPAESIRLTEIVQVCEELFAKPGSRKGEGIRQRIRDAQKHTLGEQSLAELAGTHGSGGGPDSGAAQVRAEPAAG